jgi:hypothetical protein
MAMRHLLAAGAVALLAGFASQAAAQSNIDKMRGFKVTGTSLDIPTVSQDPDYIAQLRRNLEHVKLPPGFKIDVFAIVPDARHMAVSKSIGVVFTGTRKSLAWAITDRNRDRIADEVKVLAPASCTSSSTTAFSSCRRSSSSTRARTSPLTVSSNRWSLSRKNPSTMVPGPARSGPTTSSTLPLASLSMFPRKRSWNFTRRGVSAASSA